MLDKAYEELDCGAWLVGRITGQEYGKGGVYATIAEPIAKGNWIIKPNSGGYGIVPDPNGKIVWERSQIDGDQIVCVLTSQVDEGHLAGLRADGVSYVFAGERTLDLAKALEIAADEFGVRRLCLQGGGVTNGQFLAAGLIDELSVMVFPTFDARPGVSSLVEAPMSLSRIGSVELLEHRGMDGGVVWLRYRIGRASH